ncbi:NAD(P)H-dependent flavin oxidoreductase [Comamonas endophytica]|uniref:NAD(P)H-dependent flavin oxidoreductase n=1 Tax=Comamonas endophytica TaxID=2949090 RepID=UPI003609C59A
MRLPLIAAPLFIISTPELVIAQCKAGIVGSFPALNARPADQLEVWLERITSELAEHDRQHPDKPAAPFAVNQIVHRSNERLEQDMEVCARFRVPIIISSLGARKEINDAVHAWGGIVLHDVIDNRFARKAIEKGADGLVAVAAGAGGHAGAQSPFALLQEIRQWFDGPVALSGSISSGRAILTAQVMGADLAYMGSAFIATQEANAAEGHKQMILDSTANDVVYTNLITGVHGNYLKPSLARAGLDPDNLPQGEARQMNWAAGTSKPKAWKDIWGCGQGIGALAQIQPAGAFIEELARQYRAACASTQQLVAAHA